MSGTRIAKTVKIPVSQLFKAHILIKTLIDLEIGKTVNVLLEELRDCVPVEPTNKLFGIFK